MKIDERALKVITTWNSREYKSEGQAKAALHVLIISALKAQDMLTRHACAGAVMECGRDVSDQCVWVNEAHSACINADSLK
jgi:hypothetical protein